MNGVLKRSVVGLLLFAMLAVFNHPSNGKLEVESQVAGTRTYTAVPAVFQCHTVDPVPPGTTQNVLVQICALFQVEKTLKAVPVRISALCQVENSVSHSRVCVRKIVWGQKKNDVSVIQHNPQQ
jgi:hypothetical protein